MPQILFQYLKKEKKERKLNRPTINQTTQTNSQNKQKPSTTQRTTTTKKLASGKTKKNNRYIWLRPLHILNNVDTHIVFSFAAYVTWLLYKCHLNSTAVSCYFHDFLEEQDYQKYSKLYFKTHQKRHFKYYLLKC